MSIEKLAKKEQKQTNKIKTKRKKQEEENMQLRYMP